MIGVAWGCCAGPRYDPTSALFASGCYLTAETDPRQSPDPSRTAPGRTRICLFDGDEMPRIGSGRSRLGLLERGGALIRSHGPAGFPDPSGAVSRTTHESARRHQRLFLQTVEGPLLSRETSRQANA